MALVVLGALAVQASALSRPFFADDYLFLDLVMRRPGLAAFGAPDAIGNFFRPLSRAGWFALLAPLTGESSTAFHLANLALFALVLALVAFLAWRMLGGRAGAPGAPGGGSGGSSGSGGGSAAAATAVAARQGAIVAAAFLAVHEAFDVPVAWVSGSQDLLALAFALGALALVLERRPWWGAAALVLGLLCKESIAPTLLVAAGLVWARERSWREAARRAWPLLVGTALWAAAWLVLRRQGVGAHTPVTASPSDVLAALVHGLQTLVSFEYSTTHAPHLGGASVAAVALVAVAVLVAGRRPAKPARKGAGKAQARGATAAPVPAGVAPAAAAAPRPGAAALAGAAWFALGALVTAPVANIWSGYYYSFALCGAALALGALLSARRAWIAVAVVAALGLLSAQARTIDQFAAREGRWISISHLNRAYLDRGMRLLDALARQLKEAWPSVPPRTTFVFSGVPFFTGFQVGDGPYVRYAYHDSTLRSHFLSGFSHADVERGRVLFLTSLSGRLEDHSDDQMYALLGSVLVVGEHLPQAEDAFRASIAQEPRAAKLSRLWLDWLAAPGPRHPTADPAATAELAQAQALLARGDSARAFGGLVRATERWPDDARLHALTVDVIATAQPKASYTLYQAYAARTLTPQDPAAWRRWALLVCGLEDDVAALKAIEEWKAHSGPAAGADVAMIELERALRAHQPTDRFVTAALSGR